MMKPLEKIVGLYNTYLSPDNPANNFLEATTRTLFIGAVVYGIFTGIETGVMFMKDGEFWNTLKTSITMNYKSADNYFDTARIVFGCGKAVITVSVASIYGYVSFREAKNYKARALQQEMELTLRKPIENTKFYSLP